MRLCLKGKSVISGRIHRDDKRTNTEEYSAVCMCGAMPSVLLELPILSRRKTVLWFPWNTSVDEWDGGSTIMCSCALKQSVWRSAWVFLCHTERFSTGGIGDVSM